MRRLLRSLLLSSLLVGCSLSVPFEPPRESLPWTTFPEMAKAHVQSQPFACAQAPGIQGVMAVLQHETTTYLYFFLNTPKKRFIVARMAGQDPVVVFFGHEEGEHLIVEKVEPYSLSAHGDNPCVPLWLYEVRL